MLATPRANRLHIAILGRRNAGKSSLINALTNQDIALVSAKPGTTTDPVFKAMELLPLGPVVIIDTPGIDDYGELGSLRVQRSQQVFNRADLALLVIDAARGLSDFELEIARRCKELELPLVIAVNKVDLGPDEEELRQAVKQQLGVHPVLVSAKSRFGLSELKQEIIRRAPPDWDDVSIVGDLIDPGDVVALVTPIDSAAPKRRLILPQVQTIRDIIDHGGISFVVRESELKACLAALQIRPKLVVTDSQAFEMVNSVTPEDVPLTSFSILYARYKGDLAALTAGTKAIETLRPGDIVLIAEGCTHHRRQDDIGTVKIPRWLNQRAGGELNFHFCSGGGFPDNLGEFKLVVHCGACMLNRRQMLWRIRLAEESGVPIVNYGVCIAYLQGILQRALSPVSRNSLSGREGEENGWVRFPEAF